MSDTEMEGVTALFLAPDEADGDEHAVALERAGVSVERRSAPDDLDRIDPTVDCVVSLLRLDEGDGVDALRRVRERHPDLPFVLVARDGSEAVASEAIAAGVTDYVPADATTETFVTRVADAVESSRETPGDVQELATRQQALRDAYEVIADPDQAFSEQVTALLEIVRDAVGTDYATLSRVNGDRYTFEEVATPADADLQAGDTVPLAATNCERVVETQETVVLRDVETDAPELAGKAGNTEWGISCYLGAPVTADGEVYGSFCFYDMEARPEEFSDWEVTFIDLLSDWVSREIERRRYVDRVDALNALNGVVRDINRALERQSTREEVEQLVCDHLADSDSYQFAWTGDLVEQTRFEWVGTHNERSREVVPSAVANDRGYLDTVTITAGGETGDGPTGTALQTGDLQVVQDVLQAPEYEAWREQARERGFNASAAVPIAYEDHSYGVLNVYTERRDAFGSEERAVIGQLGEIMGLAIAAIEREEQLAYERERLEFVNRFLRHNLLNDLNVIYAKSSHLSGLVEEQGDADERRFFDVLQNRIRGMSEFIDTVQAFMAVVLDDPDHSTGPVPLRETLVDELDRTREVYPDAVVDADDLPGEDLTVEADGLLGKVFQHLLTNAIQHNDADVPRVTVDVDVKVDHVTVRVADNGPGLADEQRARIFERGETLFANTEMGFGLYLVRETVEAYGGSVAVADAEPTGAVFSVTLPR